MFLEWSKSLLWLILIWLFLQFRAFILRIVTRTTVSQGILWNFLSENKKTLTKPIVVCN